MEVTLPPDVWLQPCPVTPPPAGTIRGKDSAGLVQALYRDLWECNNDKAALRDWKEKTRKNYEIEPDLPGRGAVN